MASGARQLGSALIAAVLLPVCVARAQAKPVAQLDYGRFLSAWYEIARFPVRREKKCMANQMIAYSEADKKHTFQLATSCQIKAVESSWWDDNGKLDEHGSGALRLNHWLIFHRNYWVLAVDPEYNWALVGNPNHKSLWILSKTPEMPAATLDSIKSQASAAGFDVSKLIMIPHRETVTIPKPGEKLPNPTLKKQ